MNGAIRHCSDLCVELANRGHRVVIGHKPGAWIAAQPYPSNVEFFEVSLQRKPAELRRVATLLREKEIDVVHTHNSSAHFFGALLSLFWGFPRVGTVHCTFLQPHWLFCDRVIAPAEATALYQQRVNRVPRDRIRVIPYPFDPDRRVHQRSQFEVRQELGASDRTFVILCVGAVTRRKNQVRLLQCLPALLAAGMEPQILLAGSVDRDYAEAIEAELRKIGVRECVRLLGKRNDVADLLRAADIFCLPSRKEVTPVAILEAMEQGLPVVATRVGGITEMVRNGQEGLIVRPGDRAGLEAALIRLWRDPSMRQAMQVNCRVRIRERYLSAACLPAIEECYREAYLRRRKTPLIADASLLQSATD